MDAPSIDPQEVAYYDRLADQWWDEAGSFWPLHRLNALRVDYLKNVICRHYGRREQRRKPLAGLEVLDIGCGGGILAESMAALGASVTGIDVVAKNINAARLHARANNHSIEYELTTAEALVERNRRYDVVLNMEVVEHVADLPSFMSACTDLVAREGILFVATINRGFLSWLFAIVGAEYILRWLPKGTHSWRKFVRPAELHSLLDDSGFRLTGSTGVRVNPLRRSFSLSRRLSVNYMISASRKNRF